jgi:hypothetical protein
MPKTMKGEGFRECKRLYSCSYADGESGDNLEDKKNLEKKGVLKRIQLANVYGEVRRNHKPFLSTSQAKHLSLHQ